MKFLNSPKCWLVVFVIMTTASIIGSIQQPTWVEKALLNQKHSFKILTGFYWKSQSSNENNTTIIERSYLLFPGFKPISIEKTIYNDNESIVVDASPLSSYLGVLMYFISFIISLRYLITLHKNRRVSSRHQTSTD